MCVCVCVKTNFVEFLYVYYKISSSSFYEHINQNCFLNMQRDSKETFNHLYIRSKLLYYNKNQRNIANKQYSLDFHVTYCVYFDIPKQVKP